MSKIDLNLQFLFNEYELIDRYKKAAELGYKFVELQNPYGIDLNELKLLINDLGLKQVLINVDVLDESTGIMNLALNPNKKDEFKRRIENSVKYCDQLNVNAINCIPGPKLNDVEDSIQYDTFIENLLYSSPLFESCGTKLLMEPINVYDQPGFFINNSTDGAKVVEDVNHNNFGLQYDVYHMQLMEGNLMNNIEKHISIIGHFQIADVVGRNEPGTGEINYHTIFKHIDSLGYEGFIGAEYKPLKTTEEGLSWIKEYENIQVS